MSNIDQLESEIRSLYANASMPLDRDVIVPILIDLLNRIKSLENAISNQDWVNQ